MENAFCNTLVKGRWIENEEEFIRSCWTALRKREGS
jgi:hypothetical protein